MKRWLIVVSWILNVFLSFYCGYPYFKGHAQKALMAKMPIQSIPMTTHPLSIQKYKVAILLPATHAALDEIQMSFQETIIKKYKLNTIFKIYNANGNRSLLRAQIEEIGQQPYNLVLTIGAVASQLTKEIFTKRKVTMPVVFAAVVDPIRLGLVQDLSKPEGFITGAAATTNYPLQIDLLMLLKPSLKRVLLVYDPTQSSGLDLDYDLVKKEFANRGVRLDSVQVFSVQEVQKKCPLLINKSYDLIMVLKDNTVVPAMDLIISACERYKITLFVSDLDSVHKGAVLGFGVREKAFGADAAYCAHEILYKGLLPNEVPVKLSSDFRFAINRDRMTSQNMLLDTTLNKLLKLMEFVDEDSTRVISGEDGLLQND